MSNSEPQAESVAPDADAPARLDLGQAPIFIITRFSYLGQSGWKSDASRDAELLFQPERLRQRLDLFKSITLPSLAGQTDQGLRHVILTSEALPDWAKSELEAACMAAYGDAARFEILAKPPGKARAHLRSYLEAQDCTDPVIQIVLDDDDALSVDFIEKLRSGMTELSLSEADLPFFLTYPVGFGLVLRPDATRTGDVALYRHKYPFINLGLTLIGTKSGKNILAINHKKAPRRFGNRRMGRRAMFVRTVHSFNDSRVAPSERWELIEDWRSDPAVAERFAYLLAADFSSLLGAEV